MNSDDGQDCAHGPQDGRIDSQDDCIDSQDGCIDSQDARSVLSEKRAHHWRYSPENLNIANEAHRLAFLVLIFTNIPVTFIYRLECFSLSNVSQIQSFSLEVLLFLAIRWTRRTEKG